MSANCLILVLALFAYSSASNTWDACVQVATDLQSAARDQNLAESAYASCRKRRPAAGLLGVHDAAQDCREFSRAYGLARHYKADSFSALEFCSTLQSYSDGSLDRDEKMAAHANCMARVSKALQTHEVRAAIEKACMEVDFQGEASPDYCGRVVDVLATSSGRDNEVNVGHVCDKLLTGGNGTEGLNENHFVYSCVQYADNLILKLGQVSENKVSSLAGKVQDSCERHLSSYEGHFCRGFADLVQRHAAHQDIERFCTMQFELMQSSRNKNHTASQNTSGTLQDVTMAARTTSSDSESLNSSTSAAKNCEVHLHGIELLHLEQKKATSIVQMDCHTRFKISKDVCSQVAELFAGRRLKEACELVGRTPSLAKVNMTGICERAATKVTAVGLDGDAFRQAAEDVCADEVKASAPQISSPQTQTGCLYFAQLLSQAQQQGNLNVQHFCSTLAPPKAAVSSAAKPAVPAVAAAVLTAPVVPATADASAAVETGAQSEALLPAQPTASPQKPLVVKTRLQPHGTSAKLQRAAPPAEKAPPVSLLEDATRSPVHSDDGMPEFGTEDFLSGFLQRYDMGSVDTHDHSADHERERTEAPQGAAAKKGVRGAAAAPADAEVLNLRNAFLSFAAPTIPPQGDVMDDSEVSSTPQPQRMQGQQDEMRWPGSDSDSTVDSVVASFLAKAA